MELSQNLSDFFNNNGSGDKPAPQLGGKTTPLAQGDIDAIIAQEGADAVKGVVRGIYGQESGSGANAVTSTDGAHGGMQIMPDTFQRYAKPGERIDNPADNMRVAVRLIKDLGSKFGNDPAKIATGYFSGEGNVNPGQGAAWKQDHSDGNGKKVSSYVSDLVARVTGSGSAQAATTGQTNSKSDLGKAPKWADIEAKPEFSSLSPEKQAQAKAAYFDYWIAPHAGDKGAGYRAQFLAAKATTQAVKAEQSQDLVSQLESVKGTAVQGAGMPVQPEVRKASDRMWDAASPEQRKAMEAQPGWKGQLARDRASQFASTQVQPTTQAGKDLQGLVQDQGVVADQTSLQEQMDPRAEMRAARLAGAGEDPRFARMAGQFGAAAGAVPGKEVAALGVVAQNSDFDFDTAEVFDPNQSANGLNRTLGRGLAKGGLGLAKAASGYGEFLSDVMGMDAAGDKMRSASQWARGKEQAIGERGDFMQRNMEGAISSIAQQLPLMITGVAAGSQAIALGGMAVQTFGQEYSDGRKQGQDTAQATARAAAFAALEVIGEKFAIGANMNAIKAAARGMPSDKILGFVAEALAKEIPGELLTTTGQFSVDKFAPAGMGLNPNATMADYLKQVADTIVQTVMQGGMMAGGTTGVGGAVRYMNNRGPGEGVQSAEANVARDKALNSWQTNGLSQGLDTTTPAPAAHPISQEADQIVAELAQAAGLPLETVLPTPVAPPAPTEQQPEQAGSVDDQRALAFAQTRMGQLLDKRDGTLVTVPTESGMQDIDQPGQALTPNEEGELDALQQQGNDPAAVRALYGMDQQETPQTDTQTQDAQAEWEQAQQLERENQAEAQAEREAIQAESGMPVAEQQNDDDIPGFDVPEAAAPQTPTAKVQAAGQESLAALGEEFNRLQQSGEPVELKQYQKRQYEAVRSAVSANAEALADEIMAGADEAGIRALQRDIENGRELNLVAVIDQAATPNAGAIMTNPDVQAAVLARLPKKAPAPKTEKEARAQKDYGDKWFGSAEKAQAFIAKQGIEESHEVGQDGKKFTIKKKEATNGNQASQATQAQQAGAQLPQAGDQGGDSQAGSGEEGGGVPAAGTTDVQADGVSAQQIVDQADTDGRAKDAPGTRYRTEADIKAAERLSLVVDRIHAERASPAGGARAAIKSVVEELQKRKTVSSIEEMLETAAQRLDRTHSALADVVREVVSQIDQRNGQQDELDAEMRGYEDKASSDDDTPAARWTRMPTADRTALGLRLGIKPPHAGNMADRAWDRIDPVLQERLAKEMDAPKDQSSPVRYFGSSGYQLTMADAVKKLAELEKDARESKKRANTAPTKIMQGIEDRASTSAAGLARSLRKDIKALTDGYPDARREYEALMRESNAADKSPAAPDLNAMFDDVLAEEVAKDGAALDGAGLQSAMERSGWTAEVDAAANTIWTKTTGKERYTATLTPESGVMEVTVLVGTVDTQIASFKAGDPKVAADAASKAVVSDAPTAAPKTEKESKAKLFEELRAKLSPLADRAMDAGDGKLSGRIRGFTIGMKDTDSNLSRAWVDGVVANFAKMIERLEKRNAPKTEKEAKDRKQTPAQPEQGAVGMKLAGGQVVRTTFGMLTTPFPKANTETARKAGNAIKAVDGWLMGNALAVAEARGDEFNARWMRQALNKPSQSDKDSAEEYLFGEMPTVLPSILKPLGSAANNTAAALGNAIDGLGALFGGTPGKLNSGMGFDEDTYAKAKPLFQAAVANLGDAGKDLKEAMRTVIRMVLDKFGTQAAQNMKPYVVRFVEEISTPKEVAPTEPVQDNAPNTQESQNVPVPTEEVPDGSGAQDQPPVAAGDGDRQSVDAGVATDGRVADSGERVPASPAKPGEGGTPSVGRVDDNAPGKARDRAGKRTEPGATDDHVIDANELGKGGFGQKFKDNIAAIKVLKAMEAENHQATAAERKSLAKYVGWGAMKGAFDTGNAAWAKQHAELSELLTPEEFTKARASVLDAHYTSPVVVGAMYEALGALGFKTGRVLEPSVGVGNFFGLMPKDMRNASHLHGVELDSLTSRMVAAIYPKAKIAKAIGFEDFDVPSEFFDLVIGNPPFGQQPTVDAQRSAYSGFSVHNYFLAKGIDKLRPGGVMAVVVSHGFLDAQDGRARKWIGERASLIAAVRLPNDAFKENAGTSVVTDILIFQKNDPNAVMNDDVAPWQTVVDQLNVNPKTGDAVTHKVNQLFAARPDLVLGAPSAAGTMYSANEYTVKSNGDIKEGLANWVKTVPDGVYHNIDRTQDMARVDAVVPDGIKVGSFYVDASGKIQRRGADVMGNKTALPWHAKSEPAIGRMRGMIALRDTLRAQMRLERSTDAVEADIEANRKVLNQQYDDFLKKYNHLNSITNRSIFLDDTEAHLLQALEFDYDRGVTKNAAEKDGIEPRDASAKKADIFARRVAFPPQDHMTVTTAKDALLASLNYRGRVDTAYMESVYGKSAEAIVKELGDVVFEDPQNGLVTSDDYLSGDVKTKLNEAKEAAKDDPKFRKNVEALEKVIPKDKNPSEIAVSLGASFVPAELYEQFATHITGGTMKASYLKATGQWLTAFDANTTQTLNRGKFGTDNLSAQQLMEMTMMGRGAVVKQTIKNADGSTSTHVLEKETEAAREKQTTIKQEWQKWIWANPARAERVAQIYNDTMNRIVVRKFDGSHQTFPGMNPTVNLLAHQKDGVWRGLQSYRVLYDHVVGAGKTYLMATLAMEMRRLGIARKPLFVVPNHLTGQWLSEFMRLYPGANVLAATPEDFAKDKRERMFSKIITGDWDAVVVGHSSLKKFGLPIETEKAILQEQIDELAEAIETMKRGRGDRRIVGDMERIRKTLDSKMKEKLAAVGKRSKVLTFDELGVDAMFVDEMHEFKNLTYNSTMDRSPGMGNPAGSAKAFDMFVKVRWLFDTFGDKTPFVTATGTPVSNSLVEMFNMQRYMQYPDLKANSLHVFDAWAKQFGSVESVYEVAPSGAGYRQSTRFAKFTNLPALMNLYNSFADTITLDDLKAQELARGKVFPVPKVMGGRPALVVAERSPMVAAFMGVPKAQIDEHGQIIFKANLDGEVTITQDDKGKWTAKVGDTHLGQSDTEQDARMKVVEAAMSPVVAVEPGSILWQFENLRNLMKDSKGKVNALSITGMANKAGLDFRLVDPTAPDFAGSKINLAIGRMMEVYKQWEADKGTQLVFCDLSIPLSARTHYGSQSRRLYVRDEAGEVSLKKGTLHAVPGMESLPFFVVQRTGKEDKRFDVFDAASGVMVATTLASKASAQEAAQALLGDETNRQAWVDKREEAGEISQDAIDAYNDDNDVEDLDNPELFYLREDIAGMSGSAKFSVYDDMKAKLIAKGVPEREIAFIHDYGTPTAKAKLFKAVKDGQVRFLFGSTPKMGAGTNVQDRLVGLHHIDAPWRPSDLEQREGRIIRQGNKLYQRDPQGFEVFIGRYATSQTYDTRRWQILEHKARGIEQLRNYDGTLNEIEDIDGEAATSADMKAAASGDPLILEETKLRNESKRLERLQAAHQDEVVSMTRRAQAAEYHATKLGPKGIAEAEKLIETSNKHPLDKDGLAPVQMDGERPAVGKEAVEKALKSGFERVQFNMATIQVFTYRGVTFSFQKGVDGVDLATPVGFSGHWRDTEVFSPSGAVQRLKNFIDRLQPHIEATKAGMEKSAKEAVALVEQSKQPFALEKDLTKAREDHKAVQRALMAKGPVVPESQKAMVRDAMDEQMLRLREMGFDDVLDEFVGTGKLQFNKTDGYTGPHEKAQVHPQQRTERAARNMRRFQDGVLRDLQRDGRDYPNDTAYYVPVEVPQAREIREIASTFGAEIQWFDIKEGLTKEQRRDFGGYAGANLGNVQYLHAGAVNRPHLAVLGHELAHQMAKDAPDLYEEFVDAVNAYIKPGAYAKFVTLPVANKAANPREEFSGEVLSDLFMERDFWVSLGERSPSLLRRLADMVTRLVERILFNDGYTKRSASYVSDFNKVMEIAADVMTRYAGQKMATQQAGSDDIQFARQGDPANQNLVRKVQNNLIQFFGNQGSSLKNFNWFDKTLATQYHKALKDKHFGKVFALANAMQNHVSLAALRPAELAPGVLPRVDNIKAAARTLFKGKANARPVEAAANAIFAGTLHGATVLDGKVWSEAELRGKFGLDDIGVAMYQQTRDAINASLDEVTAAEAFALAQTMVPKTMRRDIIDHPQAAEGLLMREMDGQIKAATLALKAAKKAGDDQRAGEMEAVKEAFITTKRNVEKVFTTAKNLKNAGYAPLMRFGKFYAEARVIDPNTGNTVRGDDGKAMIEFYGRYETEGEAKLARTQLEAQFSGQDDIQVTAGPSSQGAHELYGGISPETMALFADALGVEPVMRKYIEEALSERSALKRRLTRAGTAGYSEDMPRVLSSFITSNSRHASQRLYLRELNQSIKHIPHEKGDVMDEAIALKKFITDPSDAGSVASSVMFAWFLGGSVASAVVNLTQPFMMTGPYLAQHGVALATKAMAKALPMAMGKKEISDAGLRAAIKRAGQEGIVDAQEIFHLYSIGAQGVASNLAATLARLPGVGDKIKAGSEDARARINAFMTLWGSMFSVAEGFNRRLTFFAAWDVAQAKGLTQAQAYAFAVRAVNETQGVYNKVNRPNAARTRTGRVLLTFKQFSIAYMELLTRMVKHGGPEGRRAALIMLAVLMLASGEEGLPFMQDLNDLIDTIGQGVFKLDTNTMRSKRRWAHETLGKELGDLFLYGLSSQLPIDFSSRLGLGNLIPGTSLLKTSDDSQRGRQIAEVIGPAAGLGGQVGDAFDAAVEGNTGKAWANLAPTAIKNALAGGGMAAKGYATDPKGNKVVETNGLDAVSKGIGFNPTKVAQEHRKAMPVQQDIALQKRTEASIVGQWARAVVDDEPLDEVQKRLDTWNTDNPDTPISIKPTQIRERVRQMNTEKTGRILKMAPKEMRGRAGLDLVDAEDE